MGKKRRKAGGPFEHLRRVAPAAARLRLGPIGSDEGSRPAEERLGPGGDDIVRYVTERLPAITVIAQNGFREHGRGAVWVARTAAYPGAAPDRRLYATYVSRARMVDAVADPDLRVAADALEAIDAYAPGRDVVVAVGGDDEVLRTYRIRPRLVTD